MRISSAACETNHYFWLWEFQAFFWLINLDDTFPRLMLFPQTRALINSRLNPQGRFSAVSRRFLSLQLFSLSCSVLWTLTALIFSEFQVDLSSGSLSCSAWNSPSLCYGLETMCSKLGQESAHLVCSSFPWSFSFYCLIYSVSKIALHKPYLICKLF